jgi:hypothetical protein
LVVRFLGGYVLTLLCDSAGIMGHEMGHAAGALVENNGRASFLRWRSTCGWNRLHHSIREQDPIRFAS